MLINLILSQWELQDKEAAIMRGIIHNHANDDMQLWSLHRLLDSIYASHELPLILRRHSNKLGMSMLEFLAQNEAGASLLLREYNNTWERNLK